MQQLNREEATKLIREIDEECKEIRGSSIMLMEPNQSSIDSEGYQVHIKMKADWKRLRCLETIAEQYGYAVKNEPDKERIVIYNPTKQQKLSTKPTVPTMPTGFA